MINILLLEDQGLVRAGMRELIQISEPAAQIIESASYEEAVDQLSRVPIEFAFLDLELRSKKTGLDVLRYLRGLDSTTRAIMLSGNADKDMVMQCLNEGASGFIPKDMDDDGVFRTALDSVLKGGVFLPATIMGHATGRTKPNGQTSLLAMNINGKSLQVLGYVCQGLTNKAIAKKMHVEEGTIRHDYMPKLLRAFKVTRRVELVIEVSRMGLKLPGALISES